MKERHCQLARIGRVLFEFSIVLFTTHTQFYITGTIQETSNFSKLFLLTGPFIFLIQLPPSPLCESKQEIFTIPEYPKASCKMVVDNRSIILLYRYKMKNHIWLSLLLLACLLSLCNSHPLKAVPYNATQSKDYAILSGLAYCPKKCIQNWSCGSGAEFGLQEVSHITNDVTVASCFVAYFPRYNQILVSFRGSANIQNWIEDFNFELVPYSGCKGCEVHVGFLEDYRIIEEKINAKVGELLKAHPSATILATGHSLGGALSAIGGLRLRLKFNVQVDVHNFGCPRVGNAAMAQYITSKTNSLYRVVHHKDIVPHLPPESYLYHHEAFEVFYDEKFTSYVICSDSGEDKNCSNQYAPNYSAADHGFYFLDLGTLKC